MSMNRRNVLIGLGATAAGGGALLGSGAFSQVEADRSITIDVAGDAGAFVQIQEPDGNDRDAVTVDTSGDNDVIAIDLSSGLYSGDGVNDQATVRIGDGDIGTQIDSTNDEGAVEVLNNTGQELAELQVDVSNFGDLASFTLYGDGQQGQTLSASNVADGDGIQFAIELETSGDVNTQPELTITASN